MKFKVMFDDTELKNLYSGLDMLKESVIFGSNSLTKYIIELSSDRIKDQETYNKIIKDLMNNDVDNILLIPFDRIASAALGFDTNNFKNLEASYNYIKSGNDVNYTVAKEEIIWDYSQDGRMIISPNFYLTKTIRPNIYKDFNKKENVVIDLIPKELIRLGIEKYKNEEVNRYTKIYNNFING